MVLNAGIDDLAAEGPLTGPDEHLSRSGSGGERFPQHPGKAIATVLALGAAYALLQGPPDRVLVDHELRMASANVFGNPNPTVTDAEHDLAHSVDLAATGCHNTPGRTGAMLNRVLAKLPDRHQDSVPNNGNIIEVVDQRLKQAVGEPVYLGQLDQACRPKDHLGVVLAKRSIDAVDGFPQAEGTEIAACRFLERLLDFNAPSGLLLPLDPERQPHREERMQADQVAGVQSDLIRVPRRATFGSNAAS